MNKILLTVTILFLGFGFSFAQTADTVITVKDGQVDTTITYGEDEEYHEWFEKWDNYDFKVLAGFRKESRPVISGFYGLSELKHDDMNAEFNKPALWEVRLGYYTPRPLKRSSYLFDGTERYVYLSRFTTNMNSADKDADKINSENWRFGMARFKGYGYRSGDFSILPYNGFSLEWTKVNFDVPFNNGNNPVIPLPVLTEEMQNADIETLNRFHDSFRFGTSFQAGVNIRYNMVSLEASYERSVVFPRHLVWKWLGSVVVEAAGQYMLDEFIEKVARFSPAASPVVYFVLKNALSYGIYELRRKKMNWPFSSDAPLAYDQFKVGVSFVF